MVKETWSKWSKMVQNDKQYGGSTYRPERPKGAKDEVRRPEGPPARSWAPEAGGAPKLLVDS